MLRMMARIFLLLFAVSTLHTQALAVRPPAATSAMSTEIDFDRPGNTYSRLSLPLGAGGGTADARYQCSFTCYRDRQCRAYALRRKDGAAECELKSKAPKPVYKPGYASGKRIPPVQTGGNGNDTPTEVDPVNGVASCTHLGLSCPGAYKLELVRGSCTCIVRSLNNPDAGAPANR